MEIQKVKFIKSNTTYLEIDITKDNLHILDLIDITDKIKLKDDILRIRTQNEYNPASSLYIENRVKLTANNLSYYKELDELFLYPYQGEWYAFLIYTKTEENESIIFYTSNCRRIVNENYFEDVLLFSGEWFNIDNRIYL